MNRESFARQPAGMCTPNPLDCRPDLDYFLRRPRDADEQRGGEPCSMPVGLFRRRSRPIAEVAAAAPAA